MDQLARETAVYAPKVLIALILLAFFWWLGSLLRAIVHRHISRLAHGRGGLAELAAKTVDIALRAIGIVTALGTLNINVSALVAGLGLTGFAVGFALKDAISNLTAGAMILFYNPFHRGDQVSVSGLEGVVTEIDLRYTHLKADGKSYLIPNSLLLSNAITVTRGQPATSDRDWQGAD